MTTVLKEVVTFFKNIITCGSIHAIIFALNKTSEL